MEILIFLILFCSFWIMMGVITIVRMLTRLGDLAEAIQQQLRSNFDRSYQPK